ncbi:MAG: glycoside hydrolase family 18 protein [Dokdonella sp.]
MQRLTAIAFCCTCVLGTAPALAADAIFADGFDPARWVQGYYVGYEQGMYPIGEVDFSAITHLMVGRERPLTGGGLSHDYDIDNTNGPIWAHSAVNAAHAAGRKAVLMIGGAGEIDGWRGSADTPAHRATFVGSLLANVDSYGYDGLDLDWEPLEAGDQSNFIALAQALRAARPGLILTVPLGWINSNFTNTPDAFLAQIAPLFDRINIMSYDMAGPWDGWKSWHNSALHGETANTPSSVSSSVDYFLASGVPAAKLGIGSAFYGDCWHGVTAPHQDGGSISNSDGTMSYANIITNYYNPTPAARMWDATAHVPYLSSATPLGSAGCTFVTYEDAQSLGDKGAYARSHGLGGLIIWTISQGHLSSLPVGHRDPLLDAIRTGFLD